MHHLKPFRFFLTLLAITVIGSSGLVTAGYAEGQTSTPSEGARVEAKPDQERTVPGNVLRFGVHVSDMGNLDPHFAAGSQDRALADMVFNGLLRYVPGNAPRIEADLAERIPEFEMRGGRQIWTVHLRRGVMFHAGPQTAAHEMTAEDVVYSLRKAADPARCAYAGEYTGMTFETVDPYTVRIILEKPLSSVLFFPKITNYAGGFIVSKRAIEIMSYERFKQHPIGTGPFAFERYTPKAKLVLRAHAGYFRGRPMLDGVEIHFVPDIQARETGLIDGDLDVITGSGDKGWPEKMEQTPGVVVDAHGVGEVTTVYFNTRMPPLDDKRVRRALAYALDREDFMATTSKRFVGAVYSPVPAHFLPGGLTRQDAEGLGLAYAADLAKARQLLAEAGYPDGFTLDLVASEKRIYRSCYQVLRDQLARIGVDCRITIQSHAEMHKLIRSDPRPIVIYVAWRPNADVYLSRFFHSDSIVVTGARPDTNFAHYGSVDKLIEAARLEIDPEKQINLWVQAQIRILDDMAAYPVIYTNQCYARRVYVDYGHVLKSTMALYPQFTENTRLDRRP